MCCEEITVKTLVSLDAITRLSEYYCMTLRAQYNATKVGFY